MTKSSFHNRRLLYLTQWFPPEPVAIPLWIAQALRRRGWTIEVISGYPNYPEGRVHPGYSPSRYSRDCEENFSVTRAPLFVSHDSSAGKRILNYLSWAISASIITPWRSRSNGVTLVYSSPATAALPAMIARLLVGRRFVLLVQDIWPDSVTSSGFVRSSRTLRVIENVLHYFVDASYRLADAVVVIAPGAKDLLASRGVPSEKLHVIHNWADERLMNPTVSRGTLRAELNLPNDAFVLMYAGTIGPAQSLESIVRAMARTTTQAHLVVVGDGVARSSLEALARETAPGQVHFLSPVPISEIASLMADADAQLISLAHDPVFEVTMPSKVQSVLACGSVCIASASGDAAKVILAAGGRSVAPGDVAGLASAVNELSALDEESMSAIRSQALNYYNEHLAESVGAERLCDILSTSLDKSEERAQ